MTRLGERLTHQQHRVLALAAEGFTNPQIAGVLGVTEDTIRSHMRSALKKLGARNRTHAVVIAVRRGIIRLKPWNPPMSDGGDTV